MCGVINQISGCLPLHLLREPGCANVLDYFVYQMQAETAYKVFVIESLVRVWWASVGVLTRVGI